jgi:hypothetical protein
MEIIIPVKKHLYKYFIKHHGHPYKLSATDQLGIILYAYLSHPIKHSQYDSIVKKYAGSLKVIMSLWAGYDLGLANKLTSLQVVYFNKLIEKDFNKDLLHHVRRRTLMGATRIKAINEFMDYFNIEETDITTDALIKKIDRTGQFTRYKKFTCDLSKISAVCP